MDKKLSEGTIIVIILIVFSVIIMASGIYYSENKINSLSKKTSNNPVVRQIADKNAKQ